MPQSLEMCVLQEIDFKSCLRPLDLQTVATTWISFGFLFKITY